MTIRGNRVVALLPMKAHSERVREKNFRSFNGEPLFRWVLGSLLAIESIDQIIINTDARAALEEKGLVNDGRVHIRDRKPEICGDTVSMNLVLADDIAHVPADIYVMTHTTNPLLRKETICRAIALYLDGRDRRIADSVFTVNRVQSRFYRANGTAVNHDPQRLIRTQDLEPWFEENSNLYVFSAESFAATNARIGQHPIMLEMDKTESVDIDDQQSWDLAEALAMYRS